MSLNPELLNMDLNFYIADLFKTLQEFTRILKQLHQTAGRDEFEHKRLQAIMDLAKADIEELFDQVGGKGE
jgi:ribonuclease PH